MNSPTNPLEVIRSLRSRILQTSRMLPELWLAQIPVRLSHRALAARCDALNRNIGKTLRDEPAASALPLTGHGGLFRVSAIRFTLCRSTFQWLKLQRFSHLLFFILICCSFVSICQAQETASDQRTELGVRQKLVQRKMVELEAKFTIVAERIREKDAKRADLLIKTYQQSKELSLTKKMDEVSELLNEQKYDEADKELNEVVEILESLIRMLTNEKEKTVSAKEEIAMLEEFKKNVQQQLQQQRKATRDTEKAANKEDAAKQVGAQIKALKNLIEAQNQVLKETNANQDANIKTLDKIADKQFEIRKKTDQLKQNISGQKKNLNPDGSFKEAPSKGASGDPKPNSAEKKPSKENGDATPQVPDQKEIKELEGAAKAVEKATEALKKSQAELEKAKSSKGDPSQNNQQALQELEKKKQRAREELDKALADVQEKLKKHLGGPDPGKPSAGKPSGGDQAQSSPPQPPQPGQQALQESSKSQQRAEEKLGSGKPADAKRQQEKALDELEKALAELEKEKRRIESLPPEILEQLAKEQRRNRDKTMDIVKAMEKAPQAKKSENDEGGKGQQPKQPGQQQMEQAGNAQQKAADNMQQNDSQQAQEQQKQAEKKMEEALEEIEERLSQLREETNEEKLARLEARFREMLDRQNIASVMTIEIEDKRSNLGQVRLRDELLILRLATEELEIRELGQQAYDLLLEDGTSIVFPEVVQDLRTELASAADLLQSQKTDAYTQLVQKEIETTIQDLLDALKKIQQEKKNGGGGGGGGGGKQPLLKKSAELKILRMRQRRLNRRTKKLEIMREEPALVEAVEKEITNAAAMQKKILEMTDTILKKQ